MITTVTIIAVAFFILSGYLYHKLSLKDIEYKNNFKELELVHESELKELESLFNIQIGNANKVIAEYENYITLFQKYYTNITNIIRVSDARIKQIDQRGSFQSDDEIGFFFKNIKEIQEALNEFDFNKPTVQKKEEVKLELPSPIDESGKGIVNK